MKDVNIIGDCSFWDRLTHPRPIILIFLVISGIILQLNIHFNHNFSAAFTQFYYVIIVFAGLWYPKKAIWVAIFFSVFYLGMEFLSPVRVSLDSLFRVLMLCLVAVIIGSISERLAKLQKDLVIQNTLLQESYNALETGNKKLNMLSSITRHDILNQIMIIQGYLELSKEIEKDPIILEYLEKGDNSVKTIENQISFTRYYQNIGIRAPVWQHVEEYIYASIEELRIGTISFIITFSGLEIFADQLIQKVFYNLMENSLRHGGTITLMKFSFHETDTEGIITFIDDGIGISPDMKEHIFEKGYGKNTGLGLFLSREILSITGIRIVETGEEGKGVRFEIHIPQDKYRLNIN